MFLDDIETFRRVRLEAFKQKNFPIELWDTLVFAAVFGIKCSLTKKSENHWAITCAHHCYAHILPAERPNEIIIEA